MLQYEIYVAEAAHKDSGGKHDFCVMRGLWHMPCQIHCLKPVFCDKSSSLVFVITVAIAVKLGVRIIFDRVPSDSQQTHHVHNRLEAVIVPKEFGVTRRVARIRCTKARRRKRVARGSARLASAGAKSQQRVTFSRRAVRMYPSQAAQIL